MGIPFIRTALEANLVSFSAVFLGYYIIDQSLFKTKRIYYDMYDQDICEA